MRLFNIDLHVSVIEDVKTQFVTLGHEVESHLMSGHFWALGLERASRGTGAQDKGGRVGYGSVNLEMYDYYFSHHNWSRSEAATEFRDKCRAWAAENPQLNDFDGYICTYPPSFALLYEHLRGHVIVDVPVRYEMPFTHAPGHWRAFNDYLTRGVDAGKITVVANSLYDAQYYEYFTGQPARFISSTCDYIDRFAGKYAPEKPHFLGFGEHAGCREMAREVPEVKFFRAEIGDAYLHADIPKYKGVVWIPYTSSIMSFFEHYWMQVPLFVPSKRFLLDLWERGCAFSSISWHSSLTAGSTLPRAGTDLPDPHTREGVEAWLPLHDFYNEVEFPGVTYFDSWIDLRDKLAGTDLEATSRRMRYQNAVRRARNLGRWGEVLDRVAAWSGR